MRVLFSMCNQHGAGKTRCFGVYDFAAQATFWIRGGTTRRDAGITGISQDKYGIYAAVQTKDSDLRVIWFDPDTFRIISEYPIRWVRDSHSLCIHDGQLLIVSTGSNSIYCLNRSGGEIISEDLFWKYPGTALNSNEVHLNCIASVESELFATAFGVRNHEGRFCKNGELRNVTTNEVLVEKLHHPHSILSHGGAFYCTSSADSEVVIATPKESGGWIDQRVKLRGYTRGLVGYGDSILVGVSALRTRSRSKGNIVERPPDAYLRSQIVMLDKTAKEESVVIDTTRFGLELYELVKFQGKLPENIPAPFPVSAIESVRTLLQRPF